MKKKSILVTMLSALVLSSTFFMRSYLNSRTLTSELIRSNVEALVEGDPGSSSTLWKRTDLNCIYEFTGVANATIKGTITGIGLVKIKLDASGYFCYTYQYGRTTCESGGQEQCLARYCPPFIQNFDE